uniref:Uncharacterized protein n=1 Tax=Avena sativa TaxID=4498 RepID=A0ACD5V7R0_AVESA
MEGSLTVAVAIAAVLAACWLVLRWNRSSPWTAGASRLPPGSRGLPILGETLEFFSETPTIELIPFLKRRQERYGTIFRTNLVGEDLIVSLDHELNNLVFQQEEKLFQIWYPESLMRILGDDNIVTMLGTLHKHVRVLVLRIFGPENLRRVLLHEVQTTARASLLSWLDHPSIELKEATSSMIFSITAKILIGYDSSTSDGKLWKQFDAFIRGLVSFPLYFPGTAFYKCMQGRKNVLKTLKELLEERKKDVHQESIDFLDLLISDLKEERPVMSEKVALDLIFLLLFASFETTSSGIMVALKFLTDNPKALQELTEEHENILEKRNNPDSEITWEEYKSMKFTSHVIHEH